MALDWVACMSETDRWRGPEPPQNCLGKEGSLSAAREVFYNVRVSQQTANYKYLLYNQHSYFLHFEVKPSQAM